MAQANISVTESQFRCPICLDVLREPVSIPCGHTYCLPCIRGYWDREEAEAAPVRCPQCREPFSPRPVLRRNTVLAEVLDKLPRSPQVPVPEPFLGAVGEVPCDFCPVEGRLRAVRSCLVCLASFCDLHGLPHREVGPLRRHRLVEAVDGLPERLCAQHRRGLDPDSGEEQAQAPEEWRGDCLLCEADREEVHHGEAQRSRRQVHQFHKNVQGRIRTLEHELEEFKHSLESFKVCASAVLEDSESVFTDMSLRLEKTKAEVRSRLEAKERTVVGRAERDLQSLEEELEELRRREEEVSRVLEKEDNSQVIQVPPLLCVLPPTVRPSSILSVPSDAFSGARKSLCRLRSRMEEICREEAESLERGGRLCREEAESSERGGGVCRKEVESVNHTVPLSFPLSSVSLQVNDQRMRAAFLRYPSRLTFDPDTAHPTLLLLEVPQGAHCGEEPQSYPPHPQRFDSVAQVLCREGQVGGASYWEVEWRGGGWVDVGVTYRAIGRKGGGKSCLLGRNQNSWRLRCTHTGYTAWHDNRKTTVTAPVCARIGVFLEPQKGELSFYGISHALLLLHTFRCTFSQALYPAFRLDLDSTLLICPQETGSRSTAHLKSSKGHEATPI